MAPWPPVGNVPGGGWHPDAPQIPFTRRARLSVLIGCGLRVVKHTAVSTSLRGVVHTPPCISDTCPHVCTDTTDGDMEQRAWPHNAASPESLPRVCGRRSSHSF